jgi:hypothetical protein
VGSSERVHSSGERRYYWDAHTSTKQVGTGFRTRRGSHFALTSYMAPPSVETLVRRSEYHVIGLVPYDLVQVTPLEAT